MGRVIKFKFYNPKEEEIKNNVRQLRMLVDQYIVDDKKSVINKIKNDQRDTKNG